MYPRFGKVIPAKLQKGELACVCSGSRGWLSGKCRLIIQLKVCLIEMLRQRFSDLVPHFNLTLPTQSNISIVPF